MQNNRQTTDSDQARRKLVDGLRSTFFVRAVNTGSGEVRFLKSEQAYHALQRKALSLRQGNGGAKARNGVLRRMRSQETAF